MVGTEQTESNIRKQENIMRWGVGRAVRAALGNKPIINI